ncbi:uncharacterized protein BYT42DRAFT_479870, partial [Radiomyces spectabilis]|uniref:uncharacterized protein n=1 Tax=Radiomyces spectabilis TaxID=64574 RepID=UPI00222103CA
VAFYTIAPIEKETIRSLRDTIENRLKTLGIVGRIYLAPKDGIGGINCQMAVPVDQLEAVKSFFSSLEVFQQKDKSIQYTEGLQDTETASFRNLRVVIKRNV